MKYVTPQWLLDWYVENKETIILLGIVGVFAIACGVVGFAVGVWIF